MSFDEAVWFVTNVEFRQFHDSGRHSTSKVRLLEYFLNGVVDLDNDVVVLEVEA